MPECKLTDEGTEYRGSQSVSVTGRDCLSWDESAEYPDLTENYCRNPDNKAGGPWCYVGEGNDEWEFCHVDFCKRKC